MALAHVVQVGWIGDAALSVGQHKFGMTSDRVDPGRIMLATRHSGQHLQQPYKHRRGARGVLPDHVEHPVRQPIVIHGRDDERDTIIAQPDAGAQMDRHNVAQRRAEAVEHR